MKRVITTGWNVMRVIRLGVGITALVFAVLNRDSMLGLAGVLLTTMGVFNIGCGGTGRCDVRQDISRASGKKSEEIQFEEIKN